jgi:hypothetical protein
MELNDGTTIKRETKLSTKEIACHIYIFRYFRE